MTAADKLKASLAALIAVVGLYYSILGLVTSPVPLRFGVFLVTLLVAGSLFYTSEPGKRFVAYARGAALEVRKVVWPGREEVLKMSGIVLVFVAVVAVFLWIVDSILAWLLQFISL